MTELYLLKFEVADRLDDAMVELPSGTSIQIAKRDLLMTQAHYDELSEVLSDFDFKIEIKEMN